MKVLDEKNLKWKIVETKTGAKLIVIEDGPNHLRIEQNPLKNSKYGVAYRELKQVYPDLYLFWEIKDGNFTGKLKVEMFTDKKTMDKFIESLIGNSNFKNYEDIGKNE